jgi:general secretion pathway protein L
MSLEQASIQIGRLRGIALDVFQAWLREWLLLAGEARAILLAPPNLTTVEFRKTEIAVARMGRPPTLIPLDDNLDGRSPISALQLETSGESHVALVVPACQVLRPIIRLPKAPSKILRKALQFELARLSPVEPAQVYFDFRAEIPKEGGTEAKIHVRMIRRAIADKALATCHAAGMSVAAILFEGDQRPADWQIFPVDCQALLLSLWQRFGAPALSTLALLLAVLLLVSAYARGATGLSDLQVQIERARVQAQAVERLRAQAQTIARDQAFLAAEKQKPLFAAVLAELSRVLPNDTWLADMQLTGKKVRLTGYSRSASHLIANIESSRTFRSAQFEAPVTRDSSNNTERFDVGFEVTR